MIATLDFLEKRFETFNTLCFDGALPPVPIRLSRAVRTLGACTYRKRRRLFGPTEYEGFVLRISTRYDLPEAELEDILLHEMIHYELLVNRRKDTSAHGRLFRARMKEINERFGRHITVSHRASSLPPASETAAAPTLRMVARVRLKDGREGVKVLPRIEARWKAYRRTLLRSGEVESVELYLTDDPWFSRFPKSSAFNVFFPSDPDFASHFRDSERQK